MEKIGQPVKLLKPMVKEKLLAALAKGATYVIACGYAGISYQQFTVYRKKGEALLDMHEEQLENHPDKFYHDFVCDLRRVEAYAALKWLEKIDNASNFHWQAAAWKLERRHPEEYGKFEKESKKEGEDEALHRARSEVTRLKGDDHGRSTPTEG